MSRRVLIAAFAAVFALALCACGSGGVNQSAASSQPSAESAASSDAASAQAESESVNAPQEFDPAVTNIDYSLESGSIRFDRFEKANEGLVDNDNAYVFVFDFANEQSKPAQVYSAFYIQFFQNGVELNSSSSYSSNGGDQYDLVSSYFKDVMKGGTVTFGMIVEAKDDSPITVMVSPVGEPLEDNYQTMEVALDGSGSNSESPDGSSVSGDSESSAASSESIGVVASAEEIDAALQGTWIQGEEAIWTFKEGDLGFESDGAIMSGTYEINLKKSEVVCHFNVTDGTVKASIPFEFDGGQLRVFNNRNKDAELSKL